MTRSQRSRIGLTGVLLTALAASACGSGATAHGSAASTKASASAPTGERTPPGRIVFRRYTDDSETRGALFTAAPDGTGERRLTNPPPDAVDQEVDWSPDGRRLVFTRVVAEGSDHESHRIAEVAADGSGLRFLCRHGCGGFDDYGVFSPDGRRIAIAHGSGKARDGQLEHVDIWVMDADGGHRRNLTRSAPYSGVRGGVAWSPDGRRLVFAVQLPPASRPSGGRALFLVNSDGSGLGRLTPWRLGANGTPDWSSKQDVIVFRSVQDEESGVGNFFTIRPDGSGLTQVTHFSDSELSHKVGFSPDGRWIVFGSTPRGGASDINVARINGSGLHEVTRTPVSEGAPDWTS